MKTLHMVKLFFSVTALLFLYLTSILFMSFLDYKFHSVNSVRSYKNLMKVFSQEKNHPMKYILQWTSASNVPFVYMGKDRDIFTSRNCSYTNCIVTSDRDLFGDVTKFDVIAFFGPEVRFYTSGMLPKERSPDQKYVYASTESSHYYPVCTDRFDDYFNWTWTYRLDSDVRWGYMLIKDKNNNIIGPNKIMHWLKLDEMDPVSDEFKEKLKTKKKAAAWFVSNCYDNAGRYKVAQLLKKELEKYNLVLDIYGHCDTLKCPSAEVDDCEKMLENDYYFYLSFENSFSEDYVTEKLRRALNNNCIPIVYGAANYTRFMPDGIYLNAKETPVEEIASKMHELIKNPEKYAEYFRWKNHYSYHSHHDDPETDEYCNFCTILNNYDKVKEHSSIKDFRKWWNNPDYC